MLHPAVAVLSVLLVGVSKPAKAIDLVSGGAFGFPQGDAVVLCKNDDLRVSVWNNNEHLFVQAVIYADGDDSLGETDDGRAIGDTNTLCIDIDGDGQATEDLDRDYALNPWPSMPGLHYSLCAGPDSNYGLKADSKGRGAIMYMNGLKPGSAEDSRIRVDTLLIPLAELGGRQPGQSIKLVYWASSIKPKGVFNSAGFTSEKPVYYSHHIPRAKWHTYALSAATAAIDEQLAPEGRVTIEVKAVKPAPAVGAAPPEINAGEWLNWKGEGSPSLAALKGKVAVVEFWATWCAPCVKSIPHLNSLVEKHGGEGLVVLSMTDQPRRVIDTFLTKTPMQTVVGVKSTSAEDYGVTGIPKVFVIGRDGRVAWSGHPQEAEFDKAVEAALKK